MGDLYTNKIYNIILLATIVGEFILPWILKHFYKGYDSKMMVMSALGSPESPVRKIYNAWLVWLGIFLSFTSVIIFVTTKEKSLVLAILSLIFILVFAIGAGVLAGLFSVNESKEKVTLQSKIHGIGAAIGFMTLLFFPLIRSIVAFKSNDILQGSICIAAFILALLFFVFFILGDKEEFRNTIFSYEGLWERMTLFFMYVPFIYISLDNLFF